MHNCPPVCSWSIHKSTLGGQREDPPQAGSTSDWFDGDKVRLTVKSRATNTDITYAAEVNEGGDGRFEITGRDAGKRIEGVIIVIGRRAMYNGTGVGERSRD
jgi:hypothetical protein